jgi:hypothetical protein
MAIGKTMLGRIDGVYECADTSCRGASMDIVDEYRGQWHVECCFCGTGSREPVIAGHLSPRSKEEFVFHGGRFDGQTIDEAMMQPRGRDYVKWAAAEHPRQAVRDACKRRLDEISTTL